MTTTGRFHLLYRPADANQGQQDRIVNLLETTDLKAVALQLRAAPELVALQLDAEDVREAALELQELGFSW